MTDPTHRLALPLLEPGQAQKEFFHNEALTRLDIAVQGAATGPADTPPAVPRPGQCWIVGATPTGDWIGHAHAVAGWTDAGWRFLAECGCGWGPQRDSRSSLKGNGASARRTENYLSRENKWLARKPRQSRNRRVVRWLMAKRGPRSLRYWKHCVRTD
ncbi:DUF2793 domain-containing protein [Sphingomonas sp.]|uniref:DUF2793 domain-containing protein n=1 Tax=Sphingomonas sp. TaxID=28214 RepID=UPI00345BE754